MTAISLERSFSNGSLDYHRVKTMTHLNPLVVVLAAVPCLPLSWPEGAAKRDPEQRKAFQRAQPEAFRVMA